MWWSIMYRVTRHRHVGSAIAGARERQFEEDVEMQAITGLQVEGSIRVQKQRLTRTELDGSTGVVETCGRGLNQGRKQVSTFQN